MWSFACRILIKAFISIVDHWGGGGALLLVCFNILDVIVDNGIFVYLLFHHIFLVSVTPYTTWPIYKISIALTNHCILKKLNSKIISTIFIVS